GRRVPVDTVSPAVFSIALLRRYDGYTFAPRVRAFKTGCADGYVGTVMSLVNTAIGRVFAAYLSDDVLIGLLAQESIRLAGANAADVVVSAKKAAPSLAHTYQARRTKVMADGIDNALDAPVPGIGTLAAPVFDHTGSIALVVALIGPSGSFDHSFDGATAQKLLAATRRLSWRFGWIGG
ncbi:IclR family transcriptional regulator domain-containing protein, partial [Paraburkholderia podalyriae]|nr:hypothetical protein [Paraburkholderia podalyriae]